MITPASRNVPINSADSARQSLAERSDVTMRELSPVCDADADTDTVLTVLTVVFAADEVLAFTGAFFLVEAAFLVAICISLLMVNMPSVYHKRFESTLKKLL
jgi:hypothetical protein